MIEEYKVGEYGLENDTEGMYARTDNGIIGKILNSNSDEMINGPELLVNNKIYCIERDSIKDIKENITDLIEVYDYVNGMIVFDIITYDNGEKTIKISSGYLMGENEMQDILTHEQYKENCYTVERKEEC